MKKVTTWVVETPTTEGPINDALPDELIYNRQKDARNMERAIDFAQGVLDIVDEADISLCWDGRRKIVELCIDGLTPEDIDNNTCPVFLDSLATLMSEWRDTGRNADLDPK